MSVTSPIGILLLLGLAATQAQAEPCVSCQLSSELDCIKPGDFYDVEACLRNDCRDIRDAQVRAVAILPQGREIGVGQGSVTLVGGSGWLCRDLRFYVPHFAPEGVYTLRFDGFSVDERFTCEIEVEVDPDCR